MKTIYAFKMLNNRSSVFKKTKPKPYLQHSMGDKTHFATSVFTSVFEIQLQKAMCCFDRGN